MEELELIKSYNYRGFDVKVFLDDYGQCYTFEVYNHGDKITEGTCGTYNIFYENEINDLIDYDLDTIFVCHEEPHIPQFVLRYTDQYHTNVNLLHRGKILKVYSMKNYSNINQLKLDAYFDVLSLVNEDK